MVALVNRLHVSRGCCVALPRGAMGLTYHIKCEFLMLLISNMISYISSYIFLKIFLVFIYYCLSMSLQPQG